MFEVVYFTDNSTGKITKVSGISGKVIKIRKYTAGSGDEIIILNDKGMSYDISGTSVYSDSIYNLSKYNVIDLTYYANNYTHEYILLNSRWKTYR